MKEMTMVTVKIYKDSERMLNRPDDILHGTGLMVCIFPLDYGDNDLIKSYAIAIESAVKKHALKLAKALDGKMTGDMRKGPVTVEIKEKVSNSIMDAVIEGIREN
jgi:hypothetical protein